MYRLLRFRCSGRDTGKAFGVLVHIRLRERVCYHQRTFLGRLRRTSVAYRDHAAKRTDQKRDHHNERDTAFLTDLSNSPQTDA